MGILTASELLVAMLNVKVDLVGDFRSLGRILRSNRACEHNKGRDEQRNRAREQHAGFS